MIQHIEELGAELELDPFSDVEVLADSHIQVPDTGTTEEIPGCAVLSGFGDTERALGPIDLFTVVGIKSSAGIEYDRAFSAWHNFQFRRGLWADQGCASDLEAIGSVNTTINGKRLTGFEVVDIGQRPATNDLIQPVGCTRSKVTPFTKRQLVNQVGDDHVRVIKVRDCTIESEVSNIRWSA